MWWTALLKYEATPNSRNHFRRAARTNEYASGKQLFDTLKTIKEHIVIFWYINWKNYSKPWLFLLRSPTHLLCKLSSTSCSNHMTTSISSQRFNHKIQGLWGLLHWSTVANNDKQLGCIGTASVSSMKTSFEIEIIKHCKVVEIRHSMLNEGSSLGWR